MMAAACASIPPSSKGQPLRVMSYNIQYGHEGLDSVADVIRTENPAIVGLPNTAETFQIVQFIKDVYLDSQENQAATRNRSPAIP